MVMLKEVLFSPSNALMVNVVLEPDADLLYDDVDLDGGGGLVPSSSS
jgi:hypothetical protein